MAVATAMMAVQAGTAIAGFLKYQRNLIGKTVVIVMCGGNISSEVLKSILC